MSTTKTYLLLNASKSYCKRSVIAIRHRLLAITATNDLVTNGSPITPPMTGMRQYSAKRAPPVKTEFVDDEPRLSHTERLKRIVHNYGATAIGLHIVISLTSLSIWYSIVYFGVDLNELPFFNKDLFGETVHKMMTGSGTFAIAYALHKIIMPFRIGATVILTPIVVSKLNKLGLIKRKPI